MALKQSRDFSLQLTFLLSACAGGSKALERSAIFCAGANKETGSFYYKVKLFFPFYSACVYNTSLWDWSCVIYMNVIPKEFTEFRQLNILRIPSAGSHNVAQTPIVQS